MRSHRGIPLANTIGKLFASVMNETLRKEVNDNENRNAVFYKPLSMRGIFLNTVGSMDDGTSEEYI